MSLTPTQIMKLRAKFPHAPESFIQRQIQAAVVKSAPVAEGVRIRQDPKPLMNKLEQAWFDHLKMMGTVRGLSAQSLRFKLANGAWYKSDVIGWIGDKLHAWECKGPSCMKNVDRGILTVKIAAAQWPEVNFTLVWKERGVFKIQRVLP